MNNNFNNIITPPSQHNPKGSIGNNPQGVIQQQLQQLTLQQQKQLLHQKFLQQQSLLHQQFLHQQQLLLLQARLQQLKGPICNQQGQQQTQQVQPVQQDIAQNVTQVNLRQGIQNPLMQSVGSQKKQPNIVQQVQGKTQRSQSSKQGSQVVQQIPQQNVKVVQQNPNQLSNQQVAQLQAQQGQNQINNQQIGFQNNISAIQLKNPNNISNAQVQQERNQANIYSSIQNNKINNNVQIVKVGYKPYLDAMEIEQLIKDYHDDEEIQIKEYIQVGQNILLQYDLQQNLQFSVTSLQSAFKLSSQKSQILPIQINIKAKENAQFTDLNNRPSIDLICVIDVSASMKGNKIELVKNSIIQLLSFMNEKDRLSIVVFHNYAERILPLVTCSQQNKDKIISVVNSIYARGLNLISLGMLHAFKVLQERRYRNQVASIFLLSDGRQNGGADQLIQDVAKKMKFNETITVHSFGFGNEHDPVLMEDIAKQTDGNFYYVQKLDDVDGMFIDALGAVFSAVAQNVQIRVKVNQQNKTFAGIKIKKTYGDMWNYNKQTQEFVINLQQLICGVSKDFMLELEIPLIPVKISDQDRNAVFLIASVSAKSVSGAKKEVKKHTGLEIEIYNDNEKILSIINDNVQMNILRVQGAEAMQQAAKLAESGNFKQGQQILQNAHIQIATSKPQIQTQLVNLQKDIKDSLLNCNQQQFLSQGQRLMVSNQNSHMNQNSNFNQAQYSNNYQQCMQNQYQQSKPQKKAK